MSKIAGSSVLITGAGRGMGLLLARRCAADGARVIVLWDIDDQALQDAAEQLRRSGVQAIGHKVDVSDPAAIEAGARQVLADTGSIDLLFNNAGIVVGKPFAGHSRDDIERSVRINVLGVMHVARAFLPSMIEQKRGHLVNMASAAALTPNPNMSVYAASKWAVLGWSESLRLELEGLPGHLRVTTVCPSYVDTGMFHGARAPLLTPLLHADVAVERIVGAVQNDRALLRAPRIVNLLPLLRGVLPARWFDRLIGRGFGIYSSMDAFVGHR